MFKKKFRSLAIVALSFLMVVSFGVGISTFDTKYTASAATINATSGTSFTIFDGTNSNNAGTTSTTGNYKRDDTHTVKIGDNTAFTYQLKGVKDALAGNNSVTGYSNTIQWGGTGTGNYILVTIKAGYTLKIDIDFSGTGGTRKMGLFTVDSSSYQSNAIYEVSASSSNKIYGFTYTSSKSESDQTYYVRGNSGSIYLHEITFTVTASAPTNPTVTFNANGGSGSMDSQTFTADTAQNLTANTFTKTGYTFAGWDTDESADTVVHTNGKSITINSSINLYAVWTANTYTIKFHAGNGGTGSAMADLPMTYDTAKNLTANTYKHATLHFAGWDTDESADTVVYKDEASVNNLTAEQGGIVNLYAVWANTITASWIKPETGYWTNAELDSTSGDVKYLTGDVNLINSNGIVVTAKAAKAGVNTGQTVAQQEICIIANGEQAIEIVLPEGFSGTITIEGSAYAKGERTATLTKTGVNDPVASWRSIP